MDSNLERLYTKAASFEELLSDAFQTGTGQKIDADLAGQRLAAWCKSAASGDWELFSQRLARDGWDFAFVLSRFATAYPNPASDPPQWIQDAGWIIQAVSDALTSTPSQADDRWSALPFIDVYVALITEARRIRDGLLPDHTLSFLTQTAVADLDYQLAHQLTELSMIPLYEAFDVFRSGHLPHDAKPGSTTLYQAFIANLRSNSQAVMVERYPVLIRLIATITRQWIETTAEFIVRLASDVPLIRAGIMNSESPATVVQITGGLSDLHNSGRSVLIVTFSDGGKVLYKPKDMRPDVIWHRLASVLNAASPPCPLRAARVVEQSGYGWMEFINPDPCCDPRDVAAFYRRTGALLALFHVLCATDMHEENIIASAADPVPIDLEMILQPRTHDAEATALPNAATVDAGAKIADSVLSTGMLPATYRGPNTQIYGAGGMVERDGAETIMQFMAPNTDAMHSMTVQRPQEALPNLPTVNGTVVGPDGYTADILDGFLEYARFLSTTAQPIISHTLSTLLAGIPARIVLRTTRFYGMLLHRLKDHSTWSDGVLWSVHGDFISRFATVTSDDPAWCLYASERRAVLDLNIPHFTCRTGSTEISSLGGPAASLPGIDALTLATRKLAGLDEAEIAWQAKIIELSFASELAGPNAARLGTKRIIPVPDAPFASVEALTRVADIAEGIERLSLTKGDSVAWIGLASAPDTDTHQLTVLGHDLHSGLSGIGYFLAAHAHSRRKPSSRALAYMAFAGIRSLVNGPEGARLVRTCGLGGALGLGSFIYALTCASEFLGDADLLSDAKSAAALITADALQADEALDVAGGAAGAVLALIKLFRTSRDDMALSAATRCAEHILERRTTMTDGLRLWPYLGHRPFTGFSHGASGYAYALIAIARATGRGEFEEAAQGALRYEAGLYSPEHNNWPDFRDETSPSGSYNSCQWCHGAGGIGLARLAILRCAGEYRKEFAPQIEAALTRVIVGWPSQADSLCCGNLGNIQFMMDAARQLGRPDLEQLAGRYLRGIAEDAEAKGQYFWSKGPDALNLSLYGGLAGVGYSLLRLDDPTLPNPLIWE